MAKDCRQNRILSLKNLKLRFCNNEKGMVAITVEERVQNQSTVGGGVEPL